MNFLYRLTVLLSSFLLFQVQLIVAKHLLPLFGGAASVLTSCMLFFQVGLLLAYLLAHVLTTYVELRIGAALHCAVLIAASAVVLTHAWTFGSALEPANRLEIAQNPHPLLSLIGWLTATVGFPFLVLATTSPLLQAWRSHSESAAATYRLYALSNLGSLAGLVTYPFLFERFLRLLTQGRVWTICYLVFAASCGLVALTTALGTRTRKVARLPIAGVPSARVAWFALPALASAMTIAVTNQICQNVAAVPLLWILPLAVYLLSFIACFRRDGVYGMGRWSFLLGVGTVLVCIAFRKPQMGPAWQIPFYLVALLSCCMVCHGEVARLKPDVSRLTGFYLLVAAGGAAGSALVVLLAPLLFKTYFWELHLTLWLTWWALGAVRIHDLSSWIRSGNPWMLAAASSVIVAGLVADNHGRWGVTAGYSALVLLPTLLLFQRSKSIGGSTAANAAIRAAAALCLMGVFLPVFTFSHPLAARRNFYGILTVLEAPEAGNEAHLLVNGRVVHGVQFTSVALRRLPTSYYGPHSGVGLALLHHPSRAADRPLRVGAIGLGAGTVAAYGRSGDYFRFYEINPADIQLAYSGNPDYFTYLRDSLARVQVIEGDARIQMEDELRKGQPQRFDLIVVDAFSGDSIPVHLLTKEAFAVYLAHLNRRDGILAFHISNHAVDLRPVVAAAASYYKLRAVLIQGGNEDPGASLSSWVLVGEAATLSGIASQGSDLAPGKPVLWTDDFSNVLQILQ
jgi:hypothetical protein